MKTYATHRAPSLHAVASAQRDISTTARATAAGAPRRLGLRTRSVAGLLATVTALLGLSCAAEPASNAGVSGAGGAPAGAAGTTAGSGAAGAAGGSGASGVPTAGVVADGTCVSLCVDASTDPDGDGWGYERAASCVVPGSSEMKSRTSCMVGAPLPQTTVGPPPGSPGVVVDNRCAGLCGAAILDPDGDGWGWEFESSCVIPGSPAAMASLPCQTGAQTPTADLTGRAGRVFNEVCTPFCSTAGSDPDADGWGYEFGATCIVMASMPATTMGIDCKVGEDLGPPAVLNPTPPAAAVQKPATVASKGFFVANGRLYDKFGSDFVIRGVNNPHIWFDVSNQYLAYQALDDIARYGANTVRIVWKTSAGALPLRRVIRRVVELRMVPMVELHDFTGGLANENLLELAAYYTREDVKQVLLDYEEFLLVNIANEWSGPDFRNAYAAAVAQMRAAGIHHTLVIDSNDFGQNAETILTEGPALLDADPQHNLLFSVHMYQLFGGMEGRARISSTLDRAVALRLPLVIGEFGWQAASIPIDVPLILSESKRLGIGYIPWSWKGNSEGLVHLDMAVDWEGQTLTTWGNDVIRGPNGITETSRRATLFAP